MVEKIKNGAFHLLGNNGLGFVWQILSPPTGIPKKSGFLIRGSHRAYLSGNRRSNGVSFGFMVMVMVAKGPCWVYLLVF